MRENRESTYLFDLSCSVLSVGKLGAELTKLVNYPELNGEPGK